MTASEAHAGVRLPPPFIFLGFLLAGIALELAVPLGGLPLAAASLAERFGSQYADYRFRVRRWI
ncbi:MAG: hypothetical protein H0V29_03335 [Thermoleophilaceae bacterium]|nr:hypothetical protein [Thermoleophilaceae bacterium]